MQQLPIPMANLVRTQLEASRRFADVLFTGTEKMERLVLDATRRAVAEQFNMAQAIAAGRDATSAGVNMAGSFLQRGSDEGVNYQAEMIRVMAEMQTEIGKSMQEYLEQIGTQASGVATQTAEQAQAAGAGDPMANPVASMLNMWESAFKEASAVAARNMSAARSSMERAADAGAGIARTASRSAEQATETGAESVRKAGEAAEGASGSRRK